MLRPEPELANAVDTNRKEAADSADAVQPEPELAIAVDTNTREADMLSIVQKLPDDLIRVIFRDHILSTEVEGYKGNVFVNIMLLFKLNKDLSLWMLRDEFLSNLKLVHLAQCLFFEAVSLSSDMPLTVRRFVMESALNYFYHPVFKVSLDNALEGFCCELYDLSMRHCAGQVSNYAIRRYLFLFDMIKSFLELGADCRQGSYDFLENVGKRYSRLGSLKKARPDLMLLE